MGGVQSIQLLKLSRLYFSIVTDPPLTVHRIIYRDLQLNCVKQRRAQQLSETNHVARLTRYKRTLFKDSEKILQDKTESKFLRLSYCYHVEWSAG